jgi:DNA-binding NarL/FixJ family response regulator
MLVFVLDPHGVYRRGVAACLAEVAEIGAVHEAATPEEAFADPELLHAADVVMVDPHRFGGCTLVRRLVDATGARVIVCSSQRDPDEVLAIIQAGAIGYLCKDTLTPDALASAAVAAAQGAGVLAPELLSEFMHGLSRVSRELLEPNGLSLSRLSEREQQVLSLVADGQSTREVASGLHYSERTVKNVLHDVVTKLNARTRSHAVAEAVRQGLI